MAKSKKPAVIEWIYDSLLDANGNLARTVVTKADVAAGIQAAGAGLSASNTANFMKDVIRGHGASGMWPDKLKRLRIGGRQVTGEGNIFEFVHYEPEQTEPFPNRFGYHNKVEHYRLQSVSMPEASRALGRDDETYLIQVAVQLAVVETHFALKSKLPVIELNHLQIGIKLRRVEIDALFSATLQDEEGNRRRFVITAEAKKSQQRILEEQIIRQVHAAFTVTDVDYVVPITMTATKHGIYVAEFKGAERANLNDFDLLELESEALYELTPPVLGINARRVSQRSKDATRSNS